ncbi:hypothetical protein HK096_010681, partial [Nowakowskiella sp. JEL0078]
LHRSNRLQVQVVAVQASPLCFSGNQAFRLVARLLVPGLVSAVAFVVAALSLSRDPCWRPFSAAGTPLRGKTATSASWVKTTAMLN